MLTPTVAMWKYIVELTWSQCNFTNCPGAIDGKHILIQKPTGTENWFLIYCIRNDFSVVVLLAVVDVDYYFTYIDVLAFESSRF